MTTAYALLLNRCGLTHEDAAKIHDAKPEAVKNWAIGKKDAPEDAIEELRDLFQMIQIMAYDAVDMIEKQDPAGVELELARDDAEANELGLPCVGAHAAALGTVAALCDRSVVLAKRGANDE